MLSSTFQRKNTREGGERREKCLNLGIYLLKHRKNTDTGTTLAEMQSGLRSFASSKRLPQALQEFSPSLASTQKHTEDCSELPTRVYLRFNESAIHYNKAQCNINICRKNWLSTAPQQTLVLILHNKTLADHRSACNSFK